MPGRYSNDVANHGVVAHDVHVVTTLGTRSTHVGEVLRLVEQLSRVRRHAGRIPELLLPEVGAGRAQTQQGHAAISVGVADAAADPSARGGHVHHVPTIRAILPVVVLTLGSAVHAVDAVDVHLRRVGQRRLEHVRPAGGLRLPLAHLLLRQRDAVAVPGVIVILDPVLPRILLRVLQQQLHALINAHVGDVVLPGRGPLLEVPEHKHPGEVALALKLRCLL
mmetsp:Transcript_6196/g.24132  ORF Transcript_6196/g.24132 Transcript_6196/m.24132 type:complete len:222 (-) Transcript_6196:1215-1880(-)